MADSEKWPSTQELLLDHLRRIVEGVSRSGDQWFFGYGDDLLISYEDVSSSQDAPDEARIRLLLTGFGIRAQDYLQREPLEKALRQLLKGISPIVVEDFLEEVLPSEDIELLEQAYAFEMLQKLDSMVARTRSALEKRHLLRDVPDPVDTYIGEAAQAFRYGFDRACISMCRACLEEALWQRMAEFGERYLYVKERGKTYPAPLASLIDGAFETKKVIAHGLKGSAEMIKDYGNDILHGNLAEGDLKEMAAQAITSLRLILSQIYRK